ncbi:MAG: response regulator [Pirellulales bacterium]|nr:response regulator [Pirellulales bacterium]
MTFDSKRRTVLMVDDDSEDCLLVSEAFRKTGRPCDVRSVRDGEEMFAYLRHEGKYSNGQDAPPPDLILLDLNMPRKDGRESLAELKADSRCRDIPVLVLTTSTAEADVELCYSLGANSYAAKPSGFRELVDLFDVIGKYWFELVTLPPKAIHGGKTG